MHTMTPAQAEHHLTDLADQCAAARAPGSGRAGQGGVSRDDAARARASGVRRHRRVARQALALACQTPHSQAPVVPLTATALGAGAAW